MILITVLTTLIVKGTSGLSKARVDVETAVSIAELNAEKALIRIYVTLKDLVSAGMNPLANVGAPKRKPRLITKPKTV